MYWKEIPVQVQAQDDKGQVSQPLDRRFQEGIDAIAMFDGSAGTDSYLAGWEWGPYKDAPGTANEAAAALAARYNASFPEDVASIFCDLHRSGGRDARPGASDHLMKM